MYNIFRLRRGWISRRVSHFFGKWFAHGENSFPWCSFEQVNSQTLIHLRGEQVEDDSCLENSFHHVLNLLEIKVSQTRNRIEDILLSIHRVEANYRKPRREKFETFLMKLADVEIHNDVQFPRFSNREGEREMHANRPSFFFFIRDSRGKNFVKMKAHKLEWQVSWD